MKFVVAVDGSQKSDDALKYAIEIAKHLDAEITVVHSVMPQIYSDNGDILIENMSDAEARSESVLEEAKGLAESLGFEVETELLYGDPADQIVDYSEKNDVDAIYVGHRGLSKKQEDLIGSVAKELIRKASVPVTIVR
ncbi:MAG: universal stress protein [Halobacteria archaeon]|nr:universal stress protein [Halobacteria archaeon]